MSETIPFEEDAEAPEILGIKRMILKETAVVELVRIDSPASFFVRPKDHIREKLVYREPYQLTAVSNVDPGMFVLAPIEERVFGRCLVTRKMNDSNVFRVFFIDEGITADVSDKCIFQIEESQTNYPWQVMQVSLSRVLPLASNGSWTPEQCLCFKNILSEFDNFQIKTCQVDPDVSLNRPSILVDLFGFNDDIDKKVPIEEMCAATMKDVMLSLFPINLLEDSGLDEAQDSPIFIEEFRETPPVDWVHEYSPENEENEDDWDISKCLVKEWNLNGLEHYQDQYRCFMAFVEPMTTVSPTEMYITPIEMPAETTLESEQWIFDQFDKTTEYLRTIEVFYSNIKNQRPLEIEEIKDALVNGKVYAMTSIQHRKTTGPSWYRCEILDVMSTNNVAVRFLDNGRKSFEKMKNLYRIHRQHTVRKPLALEAGKIPDEETSRKEMTHRFELPYDVPLLIGPDLNFAPSGKLEISQMRFYDENENLLETSWVPEDHDLIDSLSGYYA